jgi:Tfp pilus assembly protein PilV
VSGRRATSHRRRARAFSLLEAMISGALFLIAVAGVVGAWRMVSGLHETQLRRADAIQLADDVLDDLRMRFRGDAALAVGRHERCFARNRALTTCPAPRGYTVGWDVATLPGQTFLQVDLAVSWTGLDGVEHRLSFVTLRPG